MVPSRPDNDVTETCNLQTDKELKDPIKPLQETQVAGSLVIIAVDVKLSV